MPKTNIGETINVRLLRESASEGEQKKTFLEILSFTSMAVSGISFVEKELTPENFTAVYRKMLELYLDFKIKQEQEKQQEQEAGQQNQNSTFTDYFDSYKGNFTETFYHEVLRAVIQGKSFGDKSSLEVSKFERQTLKFIGELTIYFLDDFKNVEQWLRELYPEARNESSQGLNFDVLMECVYRDFGVGENPENPEYIKLPLYGEASVNIDGVVSEVPIQGIQGSFTVIHKDRETHENYLKYIARRVVPVSANPKGNGSSEPTTTNPGTSHSPATDTSLEFLREKPQTKEEILEKLQGPLSQAETYLSSNLEMVKLLGQIDTPDFLENITRFRTYFLNSNLYTTHGNDEKIASLAILLDRFNPIFSHLDPERLTFKYVQLFYYLRYLILFLTQIESTPGFDQTTLFKKFKSDSVILIFGILNHELGKLLKNPGLSKLEKALGMNREQNKGDDIQTTTDIEPLQDPAYPLLTEEFIENCNYILNTATDPLFLTHSRLQNHINTVFKWTDLEAINPSTIFVFNGLGLDPSDKSSRAYFIRLYLVLAQLIDTGLFKSMPELADGLPEIISKLELLANIYSGPNYDTNGIKPKTGLRELQNETEQKLKDFILSLCVKIEKFTIGDNSNLDQPSTTTIMSSDHEELKKMIKSKIVFPTPHAP